ncbi:uncharacterized protein Dana_GF11629 [Drosophila ananassae]|uniref:IMS import disulfide relay-system CHCH-CHCH-like Cx9C domain-containing protein n=1 Tax=Drosophila ananassae TaxID=7217 RepID=B3MIY2_DROAN|nr:uncharacterized protein LOC6494493 [Drosophila ananassae]EDV37048.1 uncharacterized protein Dana_GF11629 [Drosophila ananassae]
MESVRKANQRLRNYPLLLGKCADKASVYAVCVSRDLNVQHKICEAEFKEFISCIRKSAQEMKTKL